MADKMIWITFDQEGIHCYPAAATDPKLATGDEYDVSFLASPHRHIFKFKIWIEVFTDDRDIEFIQFKRWLLSLYEHSYVGGDRINDSDLEPMTAAVLELDHKSCEMMSDDLNIAITKRYPNREVWIEVSEDGENGSFSKYENKE